MSESTSANNVSQNANVSRKFLYTWRHACDRTKGRTRDLIKKFRLPTIDGNHSPSITDDGASDLSTCKSSDAVASGGSTSGTGQGWSVHVWSTWVRRGSQDSDEEDFVPTHGVDYLSDFQRTKLTFFFQHVLDMNHDNVISSEDFVALNERIRHYTEWPAESLEMLTTKEVFDDFLRFLLTHVTDPKRRKPVFVHLDVPKVCVDLSQWLEAWGCLINGCKSFTDFPLWVQEMPKIFFNLICRTGKGFISPRELRDFYGRFLSLPNPEDVELTTSEAFKAMTANGDFPLTWPLFRLSFANFLLGRGPHGPGHFLFGPVSRDAALAPCPIDYSALSVPKQELERFDPRRLRESQRRSVLI